MIELVKAAGWPIYPIILCSIIATAIIMERLYILRNSYVAPKDLIDELLNKIRDDKVDPEFISQLEKGVPLATIFASGLKNMNKNREFMKEAIEEAGRTVYYQLGKFLTPLGTIATLAPLLGLLGTIIGMIEIFGASAGGLASPERLAYGISVALYNAAFGVIVAVPSLIFYRHFQAKRDELINLMEFQAMRLIDSIQNK